MLVLRYLPLFVRLLLRGLPGVFQYRHQLVFSWLLLMQIIAPGRNTLKQLARYTPLHIAEWHFRRLLSVEAGQVGTRAGSITATQCLDSWPSVYP